jgi:hypothetical protein
MNPAANDRLMSPTTKGPTAFPDAMTLGMAAMWNNQHSAGVVGRRTEEARLTNNQDYMRDGTSGCSDTNSLESSPFGVGDDTSEDLQPPQCQLHASRPLEHTHGNRVGQEGEHGGEGSGGLQSKSQSTGTLSATESTGGAG